MAETRYSTLVLSLGSKAQFLHNLSSFLYTTSSGRGFRCSLSSISVLLLLQAKRIDEFRPEGAGRLGGLGDFPPLAKRRELECVGLNEFTLLLAARAHVWTATRPNALNCDDASGRWRSRKRLRPQRAGIPCQSRMPHRPSSLERSLPPACRWPLRCRKAYR